MDEYITFAGEMCTFKLTKKKAIKNMIIPDLINMMGNFFFLQGAINYGNRLKRRQNNKILLANKPNNYFCMQTEGNNSRMHRTSFFLPCQGCPRYEMLRRLADPCPGFYLSVGV